MPGTNEANQETVYQIVEMKAPLLQSVKLGSLELPNRVVMAPLTRKRADAGGIPGRMIAEHYAERASAGLIISEATNISASALGYPDTPGIFTNEQIEGWKQVNNAVHEKDGKIFIQLWHVGRHSHPSIQPDNRLPCAPSAIPEKGKINCGEFGYHELPVPHALSINEIKGIIEDYRVAASNAIKAGFDGVEIHGANGYLIDQFLHDCSNQRTDQYGGSFENRCRFLNDVVSVVSDEIGSDKVGVRFSPAGGKLGMIDKDPIGLFSYAINELNQYNLAYLHLIEAWEWNEGYPEALKNLTQLYREVYKGLLMTNFGFTYETGNEIIERGYADMVAFGKWFISNPDLVERFANKWPVAEPDKNTFYTTGEKGYNDYKKYQD